MQKEHFLKIDQHILIVKTSSFCKFHFKVTCKLDYTNPAIADYVIGNLQIRCLRKLPLFCQAFPTSPSTSFMVRVFVLYNTLDVVSSKDYHLDSRSLQGSMVGSYIDKNVHILRKNKFPHCETDQYYKMSGSLE